MNLQAAVDAWTSRYIRSKEASLARLMGMLSPLDDRTSYREVGGCCCCKTAPCRFWVQAEGEEGRLRERVLTMRHRRHRLSMREQPRHRRRLVEIGLKAYAR